MNTKDTRDQQAAVLNALRNPKYLWRTVKGISQETRIAQEIVLDIISKISDQVVKSSIPSKNGEDLYTTRNHFLEKASPFKKIRGAFRNRLY